MELEGWDQAASPYHEGEVELHARLGRKERQERVARRIHRPYMPRQHRDFFASLPLLVTGTVDAYGQPWASAVFGEPGFVSSPDDRHLSVNAAPIVGDPLQANLQTGSSIGFVGIELATRRRNRMNGIVASTRPGGFTASVVQSFGNCPQYIQSRQLLRERTGGEPLEPPLQRFTTLDGDAARVIRKADTFFVASHNDRDDPRVNGGADVNHRGGRPGFIKVDGNSLTIPDYIGNFAFNTFGNFLVNPKAGLLFIDFDNGDLWQLTGTVDLLWNPDAEVAAFRGAERAWRFHLEHGQRLRQAAPLRWETGEPSPNSRHTGNWQEATQVLAASATRDTWRPFRIRQIEDESDVIRSFYLEPADGRGILNYKPGQFLTIRVSPSGSKDFVRNYTLSSAPSDDGYRLSVKREATHDAPDGVVSNYLHRSLSVGDVVDTRAPRGEFWLDTAETRPAALFAAGVGITPMIAMARQAASEGLSRRHRRPLTVFHAARNSAERAFADDFATLADASEASLRYLSILEYPRADEIAGEDFHARGRLTREIMQSALPLADYDCYLCGPPPFMQAVYALLIELGVPDSRIHAESFGTASLRRSGSGSEGTAGDSTAMDSAAADSAAFRPVPGNGALGGKVGESVIAAPVEAAIVAFEEAGLEQAWSPGDGTLLELAEAHGLTPTFGCRAGACGACSVPLLAGEIAYASQPLMTPPKGEVLICCSMPTAAAGPVRLKL